MLQFAVNRARVSTFVVPGPEMLNLYGLDPAAAGLKVVATPRHASLLLIVGRVPAGLARAASQVYEQMSAPRAVALLGTPDPVLPAADVVGPLDARGLMHAVATCRRILASTAHAQDALEANERPAIPSVRAQQHEEGGRDMDMGGMSMSMADMTRDLERSADGLPMDWVEATYGPLSPTLPAGLTLRLKLDGDTVARASADVESRRRHLAATWAGAVAEFPDRFSELDPFAPVAYRALARRSLAASPPVKEEVRALERERILSHLVWLSRLGFLLGYGWLADSAAALARRAVREDADANDAIHAFVQRVRNQRTLAHRLRSVARLPAEAVRECSGPTARASGLAVDARASEPVYQALGFQPSVRHEGDALARLQVHLDEIQQSLGLLTELGTAVAGPPAPAQLAQDGTLQGTIETPRGTARLRLRVHDGRVVEASVRPPSEALLALIPTVAQGAELSDALVGIASLDLSPWEVAG